MDSESELLVHPCPHCALPLDVTVQEPFAEVACPGCGAALRVRDQLDHFQLLGVVASGGMGTVYRALDRHLNRMVALKLLRPELCADEAHVQQLEREARVMASVNHPHVVKVYSLGKAQGLYYLAMELVDKGSLDDLMTLQGRVAEVQVLEVGAQVAKGLRAALEAGLIHRDVKPGNILFADAHTAKITDFGLALPLDQAQEGGGEIWGTPYYVAPEKLGRKPEDFRSDLYSLGGTLFHALAGRPPFEAENASLVALKHLKSRAVSLQAFAPEVSPTTALVINRMLAKRPEDRYPSYDELIEHLEYARAELLQEGGKRHAAKTRELIGEAAQQRAYAIFLLVVVAMLAAAAVLFWRFKDQLLPSL
jgi:serine/threonine protein kinase